MKSRKTGTDDHCLDDPSRLEVHQTLAQVYSRTVLFDYLTSDQNIHPDFRKAYREMRPLLNHFHSYLESRSVSVGRTDANALPRIGLPDINEPVLDAWLEIEDYSQEPIHRRPLARKALGAALKADIALLALEDRYLRLDDSESPTGAWWLSFEMDADKIGPIDFWLEKEPRPEGWTPTYLAE